ncbi:MAG: hypothetical protein V1904_13725 [Bacteroidota bacterium]
MLEKKGRPVLLTAICICTFIWSGIMTVMSLIGIIASGIFADFITDYIGGLAAVIGGYIAIIMGVFFLLWFLSLFGAIKMFRMKKSGFIFYIIPNCIFLIIQMLLLYFIPTMHWFVYLYAVVSLLFIILYASNLKHMS